VANIENKKIRQSLATTCMYRCVFLCILVYKNIIWIMYFFFTMIQVILLFSKDALN